MTDPTADAVKQDDCRAKWALASGDEMLLVGEDGVGLNAGGHVIVKPLREWHALANTRPQPAPPVGEPDFKSIADEAMNDDGSLRAVLIRYFRRMYRLGLAARPKIEEPEITTTHFHGQPRKLSVVLHALAAQENNDGDEGNAMQAAADYIAGFGTTRQ